MLNFLKLLQRGACMLNYSVVSAILWTVACQALLSMGFPRQEYWSRLPFPTSRDPPDSGIKSLSLASPALAGGFFTTGKPHFGEVTPVYILM